MDHSGTFAHAANGNCLSTDFNLYCNFFFLCICSHDCFCRFISSFQSSLKLRCHCFDTIRQFLDWKLHTDNTCRCYQYTVFIHIQSFRCCFCSGPAVTESLFTGTCIGNTTVTDDHLGTRMLINNLLIPFYRCCLHNICRKSTCCHTRFLTIYHCHISSSLIFDSRSCRCCLKTFCCCNSTCNDLHNIFLLVIWNIPVFLFLYGSIGI